MAIDIRTTYEFVLAQFAAECYLDGIDIADEKDIDFIRRLRNGSNHYDHLQKFDELTKGPTQMTEVMIDDFFANWSVIDHYPNTNSGFSATLLQHKTTKEIALPYSGKEPKDDDVGDVSQREVIGTDKEIAFEMFFLAQTQTVRLCV